MPESDGSHKGKLGCGESNVPEGVIVVASDETGKAASAQGHTLCRCPQNCFVVRHVFIVAYTTKSCQHSRGSSQGILRRRLRSSLAEETAKRIIKLKRILAASEERKQHIELIDDGQERTANRGKSDRDENLAAEHIANVFAKRLRACLGCYSFVAVEHDGGALQTCLSGVGSAAGGASDAGRESSNHFLSVNGETPSQNATRRA